MNLSGELILLAGSILCNAAANGARTAIPELVIDKGRDPSDRRREAATRLRTIWLARVAGLILIGVSSALLSAHLPYPRWMSASGIALLSFFITEVIPPVFVQRLTEGRANKLFALPMGILNFLFSR